MEKIKTLFLLISIIVITSCSGNEVTSIQYAGENNTFFKVTLPAAWISKALQGIDTSVGYFTNKTDTIWYDHGSLAFQDINSSIARVGGEIINQEEKNEKKSVYYLLNKEGVHNSIHGYFKGKELYQITHLYSFNLLNQKNILSILESHTFAKPE
jgi:hypothetical protein